MSVDYNNDLLLITAASGKQAQGLLPHLSQKWKRLRLNVSSASSKERLQKEYPDAEVTQHDIADPRACKELLHGVTAAYLVTPAFHPHETQCGINVVDAALANVRSGGPFKHLLHSSVIHPILRKMINHDNKRYIEEYLVESGLPYTTIQPAHLMETLPLQKLITEEGETVPHSLPWDPDCPSTSVCTRDLGEASAKILAEREEHFYATYQLVGTRKPISYNQIAEIVSSELGKKVVIERKPIEAGVEMFVGMLTGGKPETADFLTKQAPARMLLYYNDRVIIGNPNVLEMLLGRRAMDYRDWVRVTMEEMGKR